MTEKQYQEELKKMKAAQAAKVASPSAAPQSTQGSNYNFQDFLGEKLGFLEEDSQYRRESVVPDWKTGDGITDFVGNNLVNPIVKPIEQWGRLFPAIAYEGKRAFDVATLGDPTKVPYEEMQKKVANATKENPFVPGIEKSTPGENAKMIGQRTLKTMFDVATLGKGSSILKGGKFAMSQIPKLIAEGAALGAGQSMTGTEAPTVADVGVGTGAGAVLNPVANVAMHGASQLVKKLLGKGTKEVVEDAAFNAVTETALVKTPTPLELALQRVGQRQAAVQAQDMTGGLPVGSRNPATGAIEVPPGGFDSFQAQGSAALRTPMEGVSTGETNFATDLLESVLGKTKTLKLQRQMIESRVGEPFPEPGRILMQPKGQRPAPVLGKYAIERPYVTDLPQPIQEILEVADNGLDDIVPKHVPSSMEHIPLVERKPSDFQTVARNMWQPMQQTISKFGKTGQALSKKVDDFRAQEYNTRGKTQENIIDPLLKKIKLTPDEQLNAIQVIEYPGTAPLNDKVMKAVEANRKISRHFFDENLTHGIKDNMVDDTGSPIIDPDNYVSHRYNQRGWDEHTYNPNRFFEKVAEHNMKPGDDLGQLTRDFRADWKFIQQNMTPQSYFEKKRSWRIPPEWRETDLHKLATGYNASASKRYALLDHFGAAFEDPEDIAKGEMKLNYPALKQLIGGIGEEAGMDAQRYADNMMDLIIGRAPTDGQMRKIAADITEAQLISKLGPLSTVSNVSQGFLASINQTGFKHALKGLSAAFSEEGRSFARKTGLMGEGFYSTSRNTNVGIGRVKLPGMKEAFHPKIAGRERFVNLTKMWQKISGFPWSEDVNFTIATNAQKDFLESIYPKLVKNPADKVMRKHFTSVGLDPDMLVQQGGLTEDDLLKGSFIMARDTIFPRMVEQSVQWANNPTGKLLYQFMHYQLKQPQMLAKQFGISKSRGVKQLLKFAGTSAVTGEVTADMWALIQGRDRSEEPLPEHIMNNLLYSGGFGFPGEVVRQLKEGYGDVIRPGPTFAGIEKTLGRGFTDLQHGDLGKFMEDMVRSKMKGDLPIGPPIPGGSTIERAFKREPLKPKEEEDFMSAPGGFKSFDNFKGYGGFNTK